MKNALSFQQVFIDFLAMTAFVGIIICSPAYADYHHRSTTRLSPNDYMFGSYGKRGDSIFDSATIVDLSVDLGIGSDCGKIDFKNTLKASVKSVLDEKYLEGLGKNIIGSSPMLAACYFSPTWCAILQHARLSGNFIAQMRQNQCSFINKYVDSRVDEYYQERQRCVNQAIEKNDGNMEEAMESCKNYWNADLKSWAGGNKGNSSENKLIGSTAQWAGVNDDESKRTVSLVQALVGDTILSRGSVSVDFGPMRSQMTPRTYLMKLEDQYYSKLCKNILDRVSQNGNYGANLNSVVTEKDLKELSGESTRYLIDRQTIRSLAFMPSRKRIIVCQKLTDAMALTVFANDMSKSMDFLSGKVGANPNLPENRKQEAERKRRALKDQVEMTFSLYRNRSEPLNQILQQINSEGENYQEDLSRQGFGVEKAERKSQRTKSQLMDCADGVLCQDQ